MNQNVIFIGGTPKIAVSCQGTGDLVLFLHGVGGNRTNWHSQITQIAHTHRAVAWDLRGYGLSDDANSFTLEDLVADVGRVLDHFGVRTAHLVGLSMGALIALSFYFAYPNRVQSLFLANSAAGLDTDSSRADEFLASRLKPLQEGKTPADIAPTVAAMLGGRNATEATKTRLEQSIASLRIGAYVAALEVVSRFVLPGDLSTIEVPVHYVAGEDDRTVPADIAARAASLIPRCKFTVFERTGHLSNIEVPDAFNSALGDFLASQSNARRSPVTK